jgi:hypothetical protein
MDNASTQSLTMCHQLKNPDLRSDGDNRFVETSTRL